jgi:hypothetical protein
MELIKDLKRQSGKTWRDAKGESVPSQYVRSYEKNDERAAQKIIKKVATAYKHLSELKELVETEMGNSVKLKLEETGANGQRTHSIYSFDKTIQIKQNYLDVIQFDEGLVAAARDSFDKFFERSLTDKNRALKKIIMSAFEKKGGKLDPKAILNLFKFRKEIKDDDFQAALDFIEQASSSTPSKMYTQFYVKNKEGEYESIVLNFNSI